MPSASYEQPLRSRVFDYSVVAFGVALALVATGFALSAPEAPAWGYWLAVPVIALIERYPMTLFARTASVQVSFSSCLVAFLSILVAGMLAIRLDRTRGVLQQRLQQCECCQDLRR